MGDRRKILEVVREYFEMDRVWHRIVHLEKEVFGKENPGASRGNILKKEMDNLTLRIEEVEKKCVKFEKASQKEEEYEKELHCLKDCLAQKEEEIAEYKEIEERNRTITDELNEKRGENIDLKDDLELKETELENLKNKLSDKETELKNLNDRLSDKETELKNLNDKLSDKEMELKVLNDRLSDKETGLKNLNDKLSDKEMELKVLNDRLSDKETELKNLNDKLSDKEAELKALNDEKERCQDIINNYEGKFGDWDKITSNYRTLLQKIYSCDSMRALIDEAGLENDISDIENIDNVMRFIGYVGVDDDFVLAVRNKMIAYKKDYRSFLDDKEIELIETINHFYQEQRGEEKLFIPGVEKWDKVQMQDMDRASTAFFSKVKGVYAPGIQKDGKVVQRAVIQGE